MIVYMEPMSLEQSEDSVSERYDPLRGEMVIKYSRDFLDKHIFT